MNGQVETARARRQHTVRSKRQPIVCPASLLKGRAMTAGQLSLIDPKWSDANGSCRDFCSDPINIVKALMIHFRFPKIKNQSALMNTATVPKNPKGPPAYTPLSNHGRSACLPPTMAMKQSTK